MIPRCPWCGRTDFSHWSACKIHVKHCRKAPKPRSSPARQRRYASARLLGDSFAGESTAITISVGAKLAQIRAQRRALSVSDLRASSYGAQHCLADALLSFPRIMGSPAPRYRRSTPTSTKHRRDARETEPQAGFFGGDV